MSGTEDLIAALARDAAPVRRVGPMGLWAGWLAPAAGAIGLVIAVDGVCPNLWVQLADPLYVLCLVSAGMTGVLAAAAACLTAQPDRSRCFAWLPVPAIAVWGAAIAAHAGSRWSSGDHGLDGSGHCGAVFSILALALGGLTAWRMGRSQLAHGWQAGWLMGMAVGGMATFGFSLTHTFAESGPLLLWNLAAGLVTAAGFAAIWGTRPDPILVW